MARTKEECEADALRSYEKVIRTEFSVSSLEVFMNGVIQHHVTSTSTLDGTWDRPEDGQGNKTHATCKAKI